MKHLLTILFLLGLLTGRLSAQNMLNRVDQQQMENWVEAQMRRLDTPEKRLGQLIMPMVCTAQGSPYTAEMRQQIDQQLRRYHIGGIVFSKTTITEHAQLTNYAQKQAYDASLPPLLVGIDAEWGVKMRMKDAVDFPRISAIGSIKDAKQRDVICRLFGKEVARECSLTGVHISFGPVLDVNSNPKNPVIGTRAFASTPEAVGRCGTLVASAIEEGGVLSCGKHFPGHGDTKTDSHKELPLLNLSLDQLRGRELAPFQQYIDKGLGAIMTAHLNLPQLAEKANMPSSASRNIVSDLLRQQMGFRGLVITDGLAMKGACNYPDICVEALLAGNDILLQPTPAEQQWKSLLKALHDGRLPATLIDEKCRRVLRWKYVLICAAKPAEGVTLQPYPQIETKGLVGRVVTDEAQRLNNEIRRLSTAPAGTSIDPTLQTAFIEQEEAKPANPQQTNPQQTNPQQTRQQANLQQTNQPQTNFPQAGQPVSLFDNGGTSCNTSLFTPPTPPLRLPAAVAEEVGMSSLGLAEIARLAQEVVTSGAAPGCQVLVARHGRLVFDQTYGVLGGNLLQNPYAGQPVTAETMYDLASVSKAVGTLPAMMMLMQEHQLKFKDRVTRWLPELEGTAYANVTLQDLLYHESGLQAGYNFYKLTETPDEAFRADTMLQVIAHLKPKRRQGQYLYSCLNFVLLRYIIERLSGERLDQYLEQRLPAFFGPWLCYNPLNRGVAPLYLAPTEQDDVVRHTFVHGTVHDETGAWALGVEGNSGLFGSAEALAPLLQMMLDDGRFAGQQYLPSDICHQFTTLKSPRSRRGMGFDKPETIKGKTSPCADECSRHTWGHTGFTGTCVWVDPKEELIYIFLSNRICPSRSNNQLSANNYRSRIQSAIYAAIVR